MLVPADLARDTRFASAAGSFLVGTTAIWLRQNLMSMDCCGSNACYAKTTALITPVRKITRKACSMKIPAKSWTTIGNPNRMGA